MKKQTRCQNLIAIVLCTLSALCTTHCLAQTAESAGAVAPENAASGNLAQTNIWVLVVLGMAIAAIVIALILRKRPASLRE